MLKLSMAALRSNENPTVRFNQRDELADFHQKSLPSSLRSARDCDGSQPRLRSHVLHGSAVARRPGQHRSRMAKSTTLPDAVDLDHGRVECVELSRQYLHLSPLVAVA